MAKKEQKSTTGPYQVLARKWRPQQFDEVVGQEHVARTLKNAIAAQRVAHAYLFVGPRGTGKTSTARIFAKALNCEKGPTAAPCDQCPACLEIKEGRSLDVIEIDAASNTGVDNVRDLRENVRYSPARGPFKIYVIDEVHMLSTGAFNALLKTLEEPPAHVKFILATTDPQKVPATIQSRCQRFDLRRIATPMIAEAIGRIAREEGVKIDDDAVLAIARGAEGGMRDAQSSLDQLISFIGTTICEADVLSVFGLAARQTLESLAGAVLAGDISRIIELVAELDGAGKDMQRLIVELLDHFRNLLVYIHVGGTSDALEIVGAQAEVLKKQAANCAPDRVLHIMEILTDTDNRLRHALSRRTLVETALIRAARAASVMSIGELVKQLQTLKQQVGAPSGNGAEPAATKKKSPDPVAVPAVEPEVEAKPAPTTRAKPEPMDESAPAADADEALAAAAGVREQTNPAPATRPAAKRSAPAVSPEQCQTDHQRCYAHWHDLIEQVTHAAPLAGRYLVDAKPLLVSATSVTIGFDPEFADELENIDVPRNRKALQKVLSRFLHRDITVNFKVMAEGETLPGDIKLPAGHAASARAKKEKPSDPAALTAEQRWIRDPVVRKVLEEFNGEIIDIRE